MGKALQCIRLQEDRNFFFRKEAKGHMRMCEKTKELIHELIDEAKRKRLVASSAGAGRRNSHVDASSLRSTLVQAPALICDINGATLTAENPREIRSVFQQLDMKLR